MGCLLAHLAGDDDAQVTEPQPRDDKCGHQSKSVCLCQC